MAIADPLNEKGCPSGLSPAADPGLRGADPSPFVRSDGQGRSILELSVKGARCAGCIRKIETGLLALPGMEDARLNLSTGRLTARWRPAALEPRRIIETIERLGYEAAPFDPERGRRSVDEEGRLLLRCMAVAAFASMNVMMFTVPVWSSREMGEATRATFHLIAAIIAVPAALYAARPFFRSAWKALRNGHANMDVPISVAVLLTLGMSMAEALNGGRHAYFDSVVMLLFLLLVGRWLDHELREKARTAARELLALQAVTATRVDATGAASLVSARDIAVGDLILLAPGDRSPVDGVIVTGVSELDRALLTGESAPAAGRPGDQIHAGVVNLTRPLTLRAAATVDTSAVAELARLIETGEQRRSGFMRLSDRAAQLYVPVVHTLAALTCLGWLWLGDASLREALLNACAVLIITCPCALGLAAPAVQIVATGRLFKAGVLVKSGDALERLAQIDKVVLDKTGTLTLGRPRLVNGADIADADLADAAALARISRHPLSRALVDAQGPGRPAEQAEELPGQGVQGVVSGRSCRIGACAFVAPGMPAPAASDAATELWFARDGEEPRRFLFEDALRSDARAVMDRFAAMGLAPELLSGDRTPAVASAAQAAGIAAFAGNVSPADKVARLDALRAEGRRVLMIGDGLNDAAALAAAHASASPGSAVDATQAAADIVFQGEKIGVLEEALKVARSARKRMLENFALAAGYNMIAVPIAAAGLVTPLIAALAMAGSSLIVTLNALRLSGPLKRPPRSPRANAPRETLAWTPHSS